MNAFGGSILIVLVLAALLSLPWTPTARTEAMRQPPAASSAGCLPGANDQEEEALERTMQLQ